jgi:hypothetical protein
LQTENQLAGLGPFVNSKIEHTLHWLYVFAHQRPSPRRFLD